MNDAGPIPVAEREMLINLHFLKSVVFVARFSPTSRLYGIGATAFIMVHPIEGTDHSGIYFVTARHVVEDAAKGDGNVSIRINSADDGAEWISIPEPAWEKHQDSGIDIAVTPAPLQGQDLLDRGHQPIFSMHCLTDEQIQEFGIEPGVDLYFPGLFVRNPGDSRNFPIVRTGTIAAMPGEKTKTKLGASHVYLAEMRSIGGHSGSPVMVHFSMHHQWERRDKKPGELNPIVLFGVVHGHFPLGPDEFTASMTTPTSSFRYGEDFNSGIAVVTPAKEIITVFNQPRLIELRALQKKLFTPK